MSNWWDTDVNGWQYFLGEDAVTGIQHPYKVDAAIYMAIQERLFAGGFNFNWSYGYGHYPITDVYAAKDSGAIRRLNGPRPNSWLNVAYEVSNLLPLFYYRDASTFKRIELVSNDSIENIKHACSIFGIEFKGASRSPLSIKHDAKFADTIIKLLNKLVITNVTTEDYSVLSGRYGAVRMMHPLYYYTYYGESKTYAGAVASARVSQQSHSWDNTLLISPMVNAHHMTSDDGYYYKVSMEVYNHIKLTNSMEIPFAVHSRLWSWPYALRNDDFGTGLSKGEKKDILITNTIQPGDSVEIFTDFDDPPIFPSSNPVPEPTQDYLRSGEFMLCPLFNFTQGLKFVDPSYKGALYIPEGTEVAK